jgi:hypothetical protein
MENLSFDLRDVKALFIGMTGGLLIYYLRISVERYWSYRSVKRIERRIKEIENRKKL